MSKTGRQIILGIILAISVCIIPIMLLYGAGYSINWKQRAIQSTGGFTIVTVPKKATVKIEPLGLERTTPAFVSLLEPGFYQLEIERAGYTTAHYAFMLEPRRTIQFDPVRLWPSQPEIKAIAEYPNAITEPGSHTIIFNDESTQLIWNHSKNKALLRQPHSLYVYDSTTKQLVSLLRQTATITEVEWYLHDWYVFYLSNNELHTLDTRVDYGHNDVILYKGNDVRDLRLAENGGAAFFTTREGLYELKLR